MRLSQRQRIKTTLIVLSLWVGISCACDRVTQQSSGEKNSSVARAFEQRARDVPVEGEGVVSAILPDDTSGSPHQRFILRLASGQTVLIQHNTELAPRIDGLKAGDTISFSGEYIWNDKGGLIHWTHHDPAGKHEAGWIKYAGRIYQ